MHPCSRQYHFRRSRTLPAGVPLTLRSVWVWGIVLVARLHTPLSLPQNACDPSAQMIVDVAVASCSAGRDFLGIASSRGKTVGSFLRYNNERARRRSAPTRFVSVSRRMLWTAAFTQAARLCGVVRLAADPVRFSLRDQGHAYATLVPPCIRSSLLWIHAAPLWAAQAIH